MTEIKKVLTPKNNKHGPFHVELWIDRPPLFGYIDLYERQCRFHHLNKNPKHLRGK